MIGRASIRTPRSQRGITLIEVVLSSLVLAFVATGAVRLVVSVVERREAAVRTAIGSQLADQMLAEAMARAYEAPGVRANSEFGRSASETPDKGWGAFDDCDDFDAWNASPPQHGDATTMSGLDGWSRAVSVAYVTTTDPDTIVAGPTRVKKITVKVEFLGRPVATRVGFRTWAGQMTVEER